MIDLVELIGPVTLSAIAGVVAQFASRYFKSRLHPNDGTADALRFEQEGGTSIDVPVAMDFDSLQRRVQSLQAVSPRIAIIDGWNMIAAAIIDRAAATLGKSYEPSQNVLEIAKQFPELTPELHAKIVRLGHLRNSIVHRGDDIRDDSLTEAIRDIVPILSAVGMAFKAASVA